MHMSLTELEMSGLPLKHVRPDSRSILGRMERLFAEGKCLCNGAHCSDPAEPGKRGLSGKCHSRWHRRLLQDFAPHQRDSEERREIKRGNIMWPQQGQGKRKPRLSKAAEAAAAAAIAATVKRASKRAAKRAAAAKSAKVEV